MLGSTRRKLPDHLHPKADHGLSLSSVFSLSQAPEDIIITSVQDMLMA
jgi:hypothetical protein